MDVDYGPSDGPVTTLFFRLAVALLSIRSIHNFSPIICYSSTKWTTCLYRASEENVFLLHAVCAWESCWSLSRSIESAFPHHRQTVPSQLTVPSPPRSCLCPDRQINGFYSCLHLLPDPCLCSSPVFKNELAPWNLSLSPQLIRLRGVSQQHENGVFVPRTEEHMFSVCYPGH